MDLPLLRKIHKNVTSQVVAYEDATIAPSSASNH